MATSTGNSADRSQKLLLFLSVELPSGARYKSRHQARYVGNEITAAEWPTRFKQIFDGFTGQFRDRIAALRAEGNVDPVAAYPHLWRISGDQLLFRDLIYPEDFRNNVVAQTVAAFTQVVVDEDRRLLPEGLGMRGCIWTAGFPIRNVESRYARTHEVRVITLDDERRRDFETGIEFRDDDGIVDYIGPDMDLGARLAASTPPGRVSCSLDVAWILSLASASSRVLLYHLGWRPLEGIADGHPYPILWVEPGPQPRRRRPWDPSPHDPDTETLLASGPEGALRTTQIQELAKEIWLQLPEHFMEPYASPREMPGPHAALHENRARNDSPVGQ